MHTRPITSLFRISMCSSLVLFPMQMTSMGAPSKLEHVLTGVETGYVMDDGEFELEWVAGMEKDGSSTVDFIFEVAYGMTPWLTLEAEIPHVWTSEGATGGDESNMGDMELGAKAHLFGNDHASMSFLAEFEFPTGNETEGIGGSSFETEIALLTTVHACDTLAIHAGVGLEFKEGDGHDETFIQLTFDQQITDDFHLHLALGMEDDDQHSACTVGFGSSFEVEIPGWSEIGFGFGIYKGLNDHAADWGSRVVLEMEF